MTPMRFSTKIVNAGSDRRDAASYRTTTIPRKGKATFLRLGRSRSMEARHLKTVHLTNRYDDLTNACAPSHLRLSVCMTESSTTAILIC